MARIVVYAHRPKRPPPKQRPSALARAAKAATKAFPTIVAATSEKQLKRQRQGRARAAATATEPSPKVDAFFARNVRPGGPLPPRKA